MSDSGPRLVFRHVTPTHWAEGSEYTEWFENGYVITYDGKVTSSEERESANILSCAHIVAGETRVFRSPGEDGRFCTQDDGDLARVERVEDPDGCEQRVQILYPRDGNLVVARGLRTTCDAQGRVSRSTEGGAGADQVYWTDDDAIDVCNRHIYDAEGRLERIEVLAEGDGFDFGRFVGCDAPLSTVASRYAQISRSAGVETRLIFHPGDDGAFFTSDDFVSGSRVTTWRADGKLKSIEYDDYPEADLIQPYLADRSDFFPPRDGRLDYFYSDSGRLIRVEKRVRGGVVMTEIWR